jgi:hypothetical protein
LLIGLALVLANLPFVTRSLFGVLKLSSQKGIGWELVELLVFYLITGMAGWLMEKRLGQPSPQAWEFYAITFALFLTLSFPGFVYAHLWRKTS